MTNRIFTDEEIRKALECCASYDCNGCPLYSPTINCVIVLPEKALELVDRQRAKIKSLEKVLNELKMEAEMVYKQRDAQKNRADSIAKFARAEAIKGFAERLKANMSNIARMEYGGNTYFCVGYDLIDNLASEMTEANDGKEGL